MIRAGLFDARLIERILSPVDSTEGAGRPWRPRELDAYIDTFASNELIAPLLPILGKYDGFMIPGSPASVVAPERGDSPEPAPAAGRHHTGRLGLTR